MVRTKGAFALFTILLGAVTSPSTAQSIEARRAPSPGLTVQPPTGGGQEWQPRYVIREVHAVRAIAPTAPAVADPGGTERPLVYAMPATRWPAPTAEASSLDLPRNRDQVVEHGDGYYRRLDIHRWGSYAMLPLFAGEFLLGNELLNGSDPAGWVKGAHGVGAGALGVLFGVNTVTGVWNLIESRSDPGALRRILHSTVMLAADAGFVYTASLASESEHEDEFENGFRERGGDNRRHRDWALGSMALSAAGTLMMWLWND